MAWHLVWYWQLLRLLVLGLELNFTLAGTCITSALSFTPAAGLHELAGSSKGTLSVSIPEKWVSVSISTGGGFGRAVTLRLWVV